MKTYVVTLLLLLFELNLNFGHTLSKIQPKTLTDIYEVKEDQSALIITHPREEAAKLREIVYYHIIERPYDNIDIISHDKIDTDYEERTFTNSHSGIQFEKKEDDGDDEDESTSDELDDNPSEEIDDDSNSSDFKEEQDDEQSSDNNDLYKDDVKNETKLTINRNGKNEFIVNYKSDIEKETSPDDANSTQIDVRFSDFIVNTTETGVTKVLSNEERKTITNVTAGPKTKNEIISETLQRRRKREINPTVTGNVKNAKTENGLNHADDITLKRESGTYGMSLTGNKGVVWNDVKPTHIEYHVGEPEAPTASKPEGTFTDTLTTTESANEPVIVHDIDEENKENYEDEEEEYKDAVAVIEKIFDQLIDNINKPDKSENESANDSETSQDNNNKHGDGSDNDDDDKNNDNTEQKEIEESFSEIQKVLKELTGDGSSKPAITDDADISDKTDSSESSKINFSRVPKDEDVTNVKPVKLDVKLAPKKNDKDKEISNKDNDSKQQQFVKDLVKNKYFWKWLKDASAAYLEIMKKNLSEVIKTEVEKQIEQYFKENKDGSCKQEPINTSNETDDSVKGNTTETTSSSEHNGIAPNNTTSEYFDKSNETSSETSTKKHKDKPSDDKNIESPVKIEAQNLFGSSIGSSKVTNIFIYNINKPFDLENIKPIKNGTNGVFVFGLDDKKPELEEKDNTTDNDNKTENVTVKPDISSKHNNTVDKIEEVIDSEVKQTSTDKPDDTNDHQNVEDKNKIEDTDKSENPKDKIEIIQNDQTITEATNIDDKSTEINKEAATTGIPMEVTTDDKEKDATTEKEEANDTDKN